MFTLFSSFMSRTEHNLLHLTVCIYVLELVMYFSSHFSFHVNDRLVSSFFFPPRESQNESKDEKK